MTKLILIALFVASTVLAEPHKIECRVAAGATPGKTPGGHTIYTATYVVDGVVKGSCVTCNPGQHGVRELPGDPVARRFATLPAR